MKSQEVTVILENVVESYSGPDVMGGQIKGGIEDEKVTVAMVNEGPACPVCHRNTNILAMTVDKPRDKFAEWVCWCPCGNIWKEIF